MGIKKPIKLGVMFLFLLLGVSLFWYVSKEGKKAEVTGHETLQEEGISKKQKKKRKIKYWVAPMDPTYIRDKPGKSPMGMDLIPVYEDEEEELDKRIIKIDPITVQNMGVRTTKASRGPLHTTIRTVGRVTYDEERLEHVHTKISGWVEKLFVETTGEEVKKGQELLLIYSPELVATQEEYLQALRYRERVAGSKFKDIIGGSDTLIEATRKRLLLMDIDPEQIRLLEERGEVQKTMILRSPASGIIIKKHVFEGMKVDPKMELYTIADLSRVWVIASVYEYELPFIKIGQETEITLPYEPGVRYKGHITFIYPYLSPKTRTAQVRIEIENPGLKLKPDMYADVEIKSKIIEDAILVPSEAVIRTGTRNIVITSLGNGKFLPKEVVLGAESGEFVQVISGIREGETVVTSGQFLIDSESNLREAINKMLEAKKSKAAPSRDMPHPKEHEHKDMEMQKMHEHQHK